MLLKQNFAPKRFVMQNEPTQNELHKLYAMLEQLVGGHSNLLGVESFYNTHEHAIAVLLNLLTARHYLESDYPLFVSVQITLDNELIIIGSTSQVFIGYSSAEITGQNFKTFVAAASLKSISIIHKQIDNKSSYYALIYCVDHSSVVMPLFCDFKRHTISAIYFSRENASAAVQKQYADIIADVAGPYSRSVQLLQDVYQYIITHSEEPMPTNIRIARMFYTNRQKLKELFRYLMGTSLYQFYNTTRLNKAHHLISNTHLSLQQIGSLCGFSNYQHFSSLFKKHFGYRPGAVVRRSRGMR